MSDDHKQAMTHIRELLWELREGPAVLNVKRDVTVKLLESCITNMEDLNVIESYAKELGWHEDMNITAALYVKDRAKKAGDEIADLAHPEFGEMGRLQEEIHNLKKEVTHWKQARESAMAAGEIMKSQLDDMKKEVEWLTFYKREVYQCLGAGSDDVNKFIRDAYVKENGIDGVPEKLRKEYLDYEADHGRG
jgi:hypothetical protein